MKNCYSLFIIFLLSCFTTSVFSQKSEYSWRWYPITKITNTPTGVLVRCELDAAGGSAKMYNDAIRQINKRLPPPKQDEYDNTPPEAVEPNKFKEKMALAKDDSLTIYTRYNSKKKGENIPFEIKNITFERDMFDYSITYEITNPARTIFELKDMIPVEVLASNDSLLLYRVVDYNMGFLSSANELVFPEQLRYYTPLEEMSVVKLFLDDMKNAADFYRTQLPAPFVTTGPYAGKTFSEIFDAATERDVINFLNYVCSYPRNFMGNEFKFIEIYGTWIMNKQFAGNLKNLKIIEQYDKLVKTGPMKIDLLTGTINGIPLKTAMDNWLTYFPNYNGDETKLKTSSKPFYDYYNVTGNFLTCYTTDRRLRVFSMHRWHNGDSYSDFTLQQVEKKLGKPARTLGRGDKIIYLYDRTYGTLIIPFTGEYGKPGAITVAPISMSLKKPAEITEDY